MINFIVYKQASGQAGSSEYDAMEAPFLRRRKPAVAFKARIIQILKISFHFESFYALTFQDELFYGDALSGWTLKSPLRYLKRWVRRWWWLRQPPNPSGHGKDSLALRQPHRWPEHLQMRGQTRCCKWTRIYPSSLNSTRLIAAGISLSLCIIEYGEYMLSI